MRFLVTSKTRSAIPPEVVIGLLDAMGGWIRKHKAHFDEIWGTAGSQGGGGIVNVNSLEELDAIMAEFPMLPFSDIETTPIVDLHGALDRAKQAVLAMMPPAS